jgi:hypothetical protein
MSAPMWIARPVIRPWRIRRRLGGLGQCSGMTPEWRRLGFSARIHRGDRLHRRPRRLGHGSGDPGSVGDPTSSARAQRQVKRPSDVLRIKGIGSPGFGVKGVRLGQCSGVTPERLRRDRGCYPFKRSLLRAWRRLLALCAIRRLRSEYPIASRVRSTTAAPNQG